jgi:hypothetical protein
LSLFVTEPEHARPFRCTSSLRQRGLAGAHLFAEDLVHESVIPRFLNVQKRSFFSKSLMVRMFTLVGQ